MTDVASVSTEDLNEIQASLGGDGEAYARLVRRYQDEIARYMWRFTRDLGTCEELVQEVFVQAYLSLRGYRGRSPFLHWLKRIATRAGYRFWKSRRVSVSLDGLESTLQASPSHIALAEAAAALHAVLATLAPRDRLVLTLMYLEDLPVARVAELTGWSQTMVKVQAFRARRRLKKILDTQEQRQ